MAHQCTAIGAIVPASIGWQAARDRVTGRLR